MTAKFAVTGMERSGTFWLALLLDCDPAVRVYHEPKTLRSWDARVCGLAHSGLLDVPVFVKARYSFWRDMSPNHYERAEVNAVIRYVAAEIRDIWGIPVAALVRDGRKVVRSLMLQGTFQRAQRPGIEPPPELAGDPFAACCWYWADAYERLDAQQVPVWRLEDLNTDWDTVQELCDFLGVRLQVSDWERFAGHPVNVSINDPGPPYWSQAQAEAFETWAGFRQARFHYGRAEAGA